MSSRVVIIQRGVSLHRIPFYEKIKNILAEMDIELDLYYGMFAPWEREKKDFGIISWGVQIENKVWKIFGREVYWQPVPKEILQADLIIVEQANRLLLNYLLLLMRPFARYRLALWGHGKNYQASKKDNIFEKFKRFWSTRADWWFVYTKGGANYLQSLGVSQKNISTVYNTIDAAGLMNKYRSINDSDKLKVKQELGIGNGPVGIYCGGLMPIKKIKDLMLCCVSIRESVPAFEMIVIGAGSDAHIVQEYAEKYEWLHYIGSKHGDDKVKYFAVSDVQIIPGMVGLTIIDSFIFESPLVTMAHHFHSPEVEYLRNGENGIITKPDYDEFVSRLIELLNSDIELNRLKKGCANSAKIYSMDVMAENFVKGVVQAITLK